jgi:D-glycero-D-manno-heptose 1,7-bisphosphate phosphatase
MSEHRLIDGVGLWFEMLSGAVRRGRPALLIDRDGVLVEETGYLGRPEDVCMIPDVESVIRWANGAEVPVVMFTNQAGIARSYYDWDGFKAVQAAIVEQLAGKGARIDLVLACAYHEDGAGALAVGNHPWRKPNAGMIDAASEALGIYLSGSLVVGDKISDLEAGRRGGIGRGVLVETGHGAAEKPSLDREALQPMIVMTASDLVAARDVAIASGWLA